MADKNVSMTLTVDVKQVDAATAAQEKLAAATQKTADAQKKLNDQTKAAQSIFDQKYRQQNQAMAGTAGGPRGGTGPVSGAYGAVQGSGYGYGQQGLPSPMQGGPPSGGLGLGTIAKFAAGGLAIGAANRFASSAFASARGGYSRPAGEDVFAGLSGVPILGQFTNAFESLAGGTLGLSNRASREQQAEATAMADRRLAFQQSQRGIRGTGREQLDNLSVQQRAADAEVTAAKQYVRTLNNTPNLGQYFQDAKFGERTAETGRLQLDELRAREETGGARQRFSDAGIALRSQEAAEDKARKEAAERAGEAANAVALREAAIRKQADKKNPLFGSGSAYQITADNERIDKNAQQATEAAAQAQNRLEEANAKLAKEREGTERRINEAHEARTALIAKEKAESQANLAIAKDRLAIIGQQRDAARSGAVQSVFEDEGTKQARLEALNRLNRDGIGAITDEERQLLQGHAQTRSYIEDKAREAGRNDPTEQALRQGTGNNQTYDQIDSTFKETQIEIEKQGAKIAEQTAKDLAESLNTITKQLAASIKKAIEDGLNSLNGDISRDRDREQIRQQQQSVS